jgi:hypothetical protein
VRVDPLEGANVADVDAAAAMISAAAVEEVAVMPAAVVGTTGKRRRYGHEALR